MSIKNFGFILLIFCFGAAVSAQDDPQYERRDFIAAEDTLSYRILYPMNFDEKASYPLLLFLHGAGERGSDNEKQLVHGSSLFSNKKNRSDFPAIVIFPQCPLNDYWAQVEVDRNTRPIGLDFRYERGPTKAMALVMELLEELKGKNYVKKDQIYLMGLSMGGMGTYELLSRRPDTFAAAVAICGAGDPKNVNNYAYKIPLWAFHGAKDDVVSPKHSLEMVSALLKAGAFPKMTLYDFANHNSWDAAFAEPGLFEWLFSHRLKK